MARTKLGHPVPTWLISAARDRGVKEIRGKRSNPQINAYLRSCSNVSRAYIKLKGDEIAWCSGFACFHMEAAGYRSPRHALAASWIDWGFPAGLITEAPMGSVLVLRRKVGKDESTPTGNHVTFLTGWKGQTLVRGFGGNQRNTVRSSWYDLSAWEVRAVRWPWNLADIPQDPPRK